MLKAPAARMTSRVALARSVEPSWTYSTPFARVPCKQHARRVRVRCDLKIFSSARGLEKSIRRRRAPAVANGVLAAAETFLLLAVVIRRERIAAGLGGREPGVVERVFGPGEFGAERSFAAAPSVGAVFPGLAAAEIGQHVRIGPAARALLRPAVVVAGIAARIGHDVDRGRAAQDLAAHRLDAPAVEVRLGIGLVAPVEHAVFVHAAHAERDVDVRVPVAAAGFEQKHARGAVLGQPVGQHAAGRAGADDDVIVSVGCHFTPPYAIPPRRILSRRSIPRVADELLLLAAEHRPGSSTIRQAQATPGRSKNDCT